MSYLLRGSDGGLHGFGWVVDSTGYGVERPAYENCIGPNGVPDAACVARNQVLNDAWGAASQAQALKRHLSDCLQSYPAATCHAQFDPDGIAASTANAGEPVQGYVYVPPLTNPVMYPGGSPGGPPVARVSGGNVAFTTSRGSNALQLGDTWLVSITGATANSPVTVSGSMPSGAFSGSAMGTTDASGNFSKSGTVDASSIGAWNESWSVGGVPSGSFSFTVAPVAAQPIGGTGKSTGSTSGASSSSTVIGGFDLSSVPTWGWLAAAGAAAFFMFGKGGR